jgi:dihydroorotate dehydrogenase
MSTAFWRERPGLAGGIDKDGSQATVLLSSGFGSVEFGTVTPLPEPGHNPGVVALMARLSTVDRSKSKGAQIGVSLGAGIGASPAALAVEWLAGMRAAWTMADYLCFNLSARAYRPLLDARHATLLIDAIGTIMRERERLATRTGRRLAVALKLPLGEMGEQRRGRLAAIAATGLDALVAVLPEDGERWAALQEAVSVCQGKALVIAVGGIRTAEDVRAVLAAGAVGIQVHSAFVERGVDCLPPLLEGLPAATSGMPATPVISEAP